MDSGVDSPRHLPVTEITADTDTRDILDHARQMGEQRKFDDVYICDIDSHHVESNRLRLFHQSWQS